jgi:hypothetical protein
VAFKVGDTTIYPSGTLPTINATARGAPLSNDGTSGFWAYPGNSSAAAGSGWRYRTILTHGYIAAGYKGSSPWRSVNKTWHQTDTTIYCGEQIDRPASYIDGTFSDYNAYVHGTGPAFQGAYANTSSYNLFNGVNRKRDSDVGVFFGSGGAPYGYQGHNPVADGLSYGSGQSSPNSTGSWNMSVSRMNIGCASTQANGAGYIFGGSSAVTNKLHFPSEVMYATTSSPVTWGACDAVGGESRAYCNGNSTNSAGYYMSYSNDSFTFWSFNGGYSDGNNKSLMSKYGHFYAGVYGNTNSTRWKFNDSTGAYIAGWNKLGNFGEENQQMGQDWGYMLGQYNGQQNNWTTKTVYSTDVETTLGFVSQPKGHYGTSSGCCSSAAASVCGVNRT